MTIAALQQLLDEELPDVPRYPAPEIPHTAARKRKFMQQQSPVPAPRAPQQIPSAGLAVAPTGTLIAWALQHTDKATVRLGEQARTALTELRTRKSAEEELAQVDAEEQELQRKLEAVRARKAELRPKRKAAAPRDYDPATVRTWARAHGYTVPGRGQISGDIVQAWRQAQQPDGDR
ncbi:histone-like nucleoid-structuring protein Lsr2 [Streptomyces sp. NPDC048438]|uniref:Lsr2 family DNA-binding protein n=1 Tax=Streptomyces sp. NPDC048438 TaxID=3365551 RepID=UPI00371700EB